MTEIRAALAVAVTALLTTACVTVGLRTSAAPAALGFTAGGRAASALPAALAPGASAAGTQAAAPAAPAAPARPLGPNALPLSSPKSLEPSLAALGYRPPPGSSVYAAKVSRVGGSIVYDDFQAGGGALASNFWPASSIKLLAAVGALEFVGKQGFTGAAAVSFGGGPARPLRSVYDQAIRISSNSDYDRLVELAGIAWLNNEFLTPARGFPVTVIQKSYTVGGVVRSSGSITISEGGRKVTLPPRPARIDASQCSRVNCSNLFEMSESVRRVVFHNDLAPAERFSISNQDAAGLTAALLAAEGWFEPAVARVLGPTARIYGKPGQVPGRDCMDVTVIEGRTGQLFLLSATVPESQGGCPALVTLATNVLKILTG